MDPDESRWALIQPRAIAFDGDRVIYRTAGKGPVLLLVHGMAGSAETWRHVMPALSERFTVLAPAAPPRSRAGLPIRNKNGADRCALDRRELPEGRGFHETFGRHSTGREGRAPQREYLAAWWAESWPGAPPRAR
jgi:pimeloyl-ACP methyl ester carboxylesterase